MNIVIYYTMYAFIYRCIVYIVVCVLLLLFELTPQSTTETETYRQLTPKEIGGEVTI
jgi:hypothetical protein